MEKNKKNKDFGDMSHIEIEKWENENPVIVMLDCADRNDLAFAKAESSTDNISNGNTLLVFRNNIKSKNMTVYSEGQIQRLKQFLNENF